MFIVLEEQLVFGASGDAISFICEHYAYSMPDIETFIDQKITVKAITSEILADFITPEKRLPKSNIGHHNKNNK
jgi:hypothetical protein